MIHSMKQEETMSEKTSITIEADKRKRCPDCGKRIKAFRLKSHRLVRHTPLSEWPGDPLKLRK